MEQIFHSLNIYFAFAAVVINAVFVVLVLVRTSRTTTYIIFLFFCLAVIIWNFGIFMTYFAGRGFWFYFALVGAPFMPALAFHYIHCLVTPLSRNTWVVAAYILASLLSLSSLLALFHSGIKGFVDGIYWNIYFLVILCPFILAAVYMLQKAIRHTKPREQKDQLEYFFWATIVGILMAVTELIQIFHIPVPMLGHPGSVLFSSILALGMFKHRQTHDVLAQMQMKLEFLQEIAAGLAHEIRNPLSSIKGAGKILSAGLTPDGNSKAREHLNTILEEVSRLNDVLDSFQNLARPLNLTKEPLAIDQVITKTTQLAEVAALPMAITTDLPADLPPVNADALSLKQVFLNLIKNAAETCAGDGKLRIAAAHVPPWVKISFLDNGGGIPPAILDHVFEPFFTKASGTGMRLAISQRILQAHDGRMEARNVAPQGAEISLFLPAQGTTSL